MTQVWDRGYAHEDGDGGSSLFAKNEKEFGRTYRGRYHMPLLPGEAGTKTGGDWVPYGQMRTTNLVSAFSETRALSVWEQEQMLIGLAASPSLYEELTLLYGRALGEGVDFSRLRDFPAVRTALTGIANDSESIDASLAGRAKAAAGANEARQKGTNRHDAWEHRLKTGQLIGTPDIQRQVLALEALLAEKGYERIPGLSERTVRNTMVNCTGRYDDILLDTKSGDLVMSDLKNKSRPFWTWLEVDMQLAIYANSDWMLTEDRQGYEPGPGARVQLLPGEPYAKPCVNPEYGLVLVAPSGGGEPYLRRADLQRGWANALLARRIVDERAYGKSAGRHLLAEEV